MTTRTVEAKCRNGHIHEYPGPAGRAVKCRTPECRVSLWLKVGHARNAATSGVWAEEESRAPAAEILEQAPEHPCPECGGVQAWTPGRTALLCGECGQTHLPPAVYARKPAAAPTRPAVVALTPEQEMDARITLEHNREQVIAVLTRLADRLEPGDLAEERDAAEAFEVRSLFRTLSGMARSATTGDELTMIYGRGKPRFETARWLIARAQADQEEAEGYDDDDDDDQDDDDAPIVYAEVVESPQTPALLAAPRYPVSGNAYFAQAAIEQLERERARRAEQAAIRDQYGECEAMTSHRTLGFAYRPLAQYRVMIPGGTDSRSPWYPTQPQHVADCCPRCADRITANDPDTAYDVVKLWDGPNPKRSGKPAALVALALLAAAGWFWWVNREWFGDYGYGW